MSQTRFFLPVLLVIATIGLSAAIKCSQCWSSALDVTNGIVTGLVAGIDTNVNCTATDCDNSSDACTYGHYEFTAGTILDDAIGNHPWIAYNKSGSFPSGTAYGIQQTWEKGCGRKSVDMCGTMETWWENYLKRSLSEEDKEEIKIEMGECDIKTCDTDGCNTEKTKEDMGVADPISCYSCWIYTPYEESNQEDCEQTELCAEGVDQCFHEELNYTYNGEEISWMMKGCANINSLLTVLIDSDTIALTHTSESLVTIKSRSLKVCEGNLCSDYEEMNSAGINAPTLILLLTSFFVTFLQLA